jgi:pilus assembly protein FimV
MPAPVRVIKAPVVTKAAVPGPAAVVAPAAPATTPRSTPLAAAPQSEASPPPSDAVTGMGNTYQVRPNQTLWGIANGARPNSSLSVDQTMQAILKANPDAFIDNNINKLKAGQILRIPNASEVGAISAATARAATLKQNEDWRNRRIASGTPAPAPAAEVAAPETAQKPPAAPATPKQSATAQTPPRPEAQLKVLAATAPAGATGKGTAAATTAAAPAGSATDIHNELALATEAVETQRQETEELRTRLTDLEQQISTMQKMMTIKDEQLANLQAKSAAPANGAAPETEGASNPTTLAMIGIVAVVLAALLWMAMRSSGRAT